MKIDKDWSIQITRCDNGYMCKYLRLLDSEDEPTYRKERVVFEEIDNELNTLTRLLHYILEYFGHPYNKHSDKNIRIIIEDTNDDTN